MPRDNDKNNDSRGRRDRRSGGKGRSGAARGPEKKFAKRGFAGKSEGERRPYAGKAEGARSYDKKPYSGSGKPYAGKREGASPRRDHDDAPRRFDKDAPRPRGDRPFADRPSRSSGGEKRPYTPREDRGGEKRPYTPRSDARPAARFSDKKFGEKRPYAPRDGEKRPYTPRGEGFRKDGDRPRGDRPYSARPPRDGDRPRSDRPFGDRPQGERKFGGDKKFSRGAPRDRKGDSGDRGPRKDFGSRDRDRKSGSRGIAVQIAANSKPWQKRDASSPDHVGRNSRPQREGARSFDKPRFDKPRDDRGGAERPRFSRPRRIVPKVIVQKATVRFASGRSSSVLGKVARTVRNSIVRVSAPKAAATGRNIRAAMDPAMRIGRAATTRTTARFLPSVRRSAAAAPIASARLTSGALPRPPREKKSGERIAKVVSRAGLASRRDAEEWIVQGRVTVNGRVINSPALDVTDNDVITVDGKLLPPRERTRLFLYHKPRGLMTTHADPEGRPTVFDNLPEGLPRLISIGRLDFNTEGLLLLTNDGGLARALELPDTGWLRRYRVRAHGEVTQAQLDELKKGVEVDGVKYGSIDATLERDQGANVWLVFAIREGKNREVRNVMAHLGLEVNRLIRVSYGPFQLAELEEGQVEEVKTRVLREQLGEKIAALAGRGFQPAHAWRRRGKVRGRRDRSATRQKTVQAGRQERA